MLDKIINALVLKGFNLIQDNQSENFGDLLKVYRLDDIEIRLVISKSDISMDIRKSNLEWFDLGLIKNFLLKEKNLNIKMQLSDYEELFNDSLKDILSMFKDLNYNETSMSLKNMEIIRMNQMFK